MSGSGSGILVSDKYGSIVSSYHGASRGSRELGGWHPSRSRTADDHLLPELAALTARSQDLERNNGFAHSYPQTIVDNVIGPNLKLTATPNWRVLGRTREWAKEWSATVEAHWRAAARSVYFDMERQLTFHGMADLVLRAEASNGGAAVIPRWRPNRPGAKLATCFQLIEIDRLSNPQRRSNSSRLNEGIETDDDGVPVAYHVETRANANGLYDGPTRWERIPAFTAWGRRRFIHCFKPLRAGQSRGTPKLASTLRQFKMFDKYSQAELNAAVSHAQATFFVRSGMGADMFQLMFGGSVDNYFDHRQTINGQARADFDSARMDDNMIIPLAPGDEIVDPKSARPSPQFSDFTIAVLRQIAAGLGVSYEMLARDFSRTNYSSARAAMLLDAKTFAGKLQWLLIYYAQPVYATVLEELVDMGVVEASDFYENLEAYTECRITGAGRGHIDPNKEVKASTERLANGTSNLDKEAAEAGEDWETMQDKRALEMSRAFELQKQHGLPDIAGHVLAGLPRPGQYDVEDTDDSEPDEPEAATRQGSSQSGATNNVAEAA